MIDSLIWQLDLTLQNASSLASLPNLSDDEQATVTQFVVKTLDSVDTQLLTNRDLITYIKLYVKYRQSQAEFDIGDYLSDAQLARIQGIVSQ